MTEAYGFRFCGQLPPASGLQPPAYVTEASGFRFYRQWQSKNACQPPNTPAYERLEPCPAALRPTVPSVLNASKPGR